jgi:hypothetical protein
MPSLEEITVKHGKLLFLKEEEKRAALEELQELLSIFYDENCIVEMEIPGNENRKAYTKAEIGFDSVPMPKKTLKKGHEEEQQTGDYAFKISVMGGEKKRLKIRIERKEVSDFCGTVINNWERFLGELERAKQDPEIEDFRVVVEGDMLQALAFFFTYPKVCKYCESVGYKVKEGVRKYYCKGSKKDVNYNSSCASLKVKKRSAKQIAQLIAFKRKKIGIIEAMGFPVVWCGNRGNAATYINVAVKQHFIVNYEEILELNKNGKLIGEDLETLTFEVSGMKFRVQKDAVEVIA